MLDAMYNHVQQICGPATWIKCKLELFAHKKGTRNRRLLLYISGQTSSRKKGEYSTSPTTWGSLVMRLDWSLARVSLLLPCSISIPLLA